MYQSIYYNRSTKTYHLRDDKKGWLEFPYRATCYTANDKGEYETLDGVRVSPTKQYDWKDPNAYESDVDKFTRVLVDAYYDKDDTPEYQNIVYLDIECEIAGALTQDTVRAPAGKLTAIALYDNSTKMYYCYVLDEAKLMSESINENKTVIPCLTEKELMYKFLDKWEELDPTIITGWNSEFFDIPYLYHRIANVLGESQAVRLSPLKKVDEGEFAGEKYTTIAGINHLDYMLLFKKYITAQEPSYALGNIGEKYVDLGKVDYLGSLDKLFKEDVNKFIDYNIRDVEIIEKLEEKQKFIELTILISHLCHTPYESIYYNTALNEGAILTYLKRKNIVSPNKPTTTNPSIKEINLEDHIVHQRGTPTIEGIVREIRDNQVTIQTLAGSYMMRDVKTIKRKDGYAGGFLLDPTPGLYDWLSDFDYSSLYPSIIRSLNLSIETLLGRIKIPNQNYNKWCSLVELEEMNPNDKIIIERLNKYTYSIIEKTTTVNKLTHAIKSNNYIISANGTIFDSSKKSVVAEILTDWFNLRKKYKKIMKDSYKDGDLLNGELYNQKQHSIKILLNSVYGGFAINSFRYTDGYKMLSSSITTTGQRFIMETIKYADEIIEKEYII